MRSSFVRQVRVLLLVKAMIKEMTKSTRKIKNRISAIPAAAPAIPVKPKSAATSAITKKITAHFSMVLPSFHYLMKHAFHSKQTDKYPGHVDCELKYAPDSLEMKWGVWGKWSAETG